MDSFTLPEDLAALSDEDIEGLISDGLEAFERVFAEPRSAENAAALRDLRDAVNSLKGEKTTRAEAQAAIDAEYDQLGAEMTDEEPATLQDEDEEEDEPDAPVELPVDEALDPPAPSEEEEDEEEPVMAEATAASADPTPLPDPEPEPTQTEQTEAVAASATPARRSIPLPKRKNPAPPPEETPVPAATIVAAANVPEFTSGATMTMEDLSSAFAAKFATFPSGRRGGPAIRGGVAKIIKPFPDDLVVSSDADAERVLTHATTESRLEGNSLVAAGGWCAPSETLYDLCTLETVEGILSLPSVQVNRGGIIHTTGPDFRSIYDATGFCFTEADDISGDYDGEGGDKPCFNVPCPEFEEDRLDVCGTCITADVLQDTAYPELTRRITEGSLVAHAHNLNANVIAKVVALSTAVTVGASIGAAAPILEAIELQVEDMRYRNRMARSRAVELVAPFWVRPLIRADLAKRMGVDLMSVSDSMIDTKLRERGVNPQFVYDWQDNFVDGAAVFGASSAPTAWPTAVQFLLYPSGTFIKGEKDVLQLDAIYDSVNIKSNSFTALFMEEAYLVAKRCHDARILTVDNLCAEGETNSGANPCES